MALNPGQLATDLGSIFSDLEKDSVKEQPFADAIKNYFISGTPMTSDSGSFPSLIVIATVISPGQSGSADGEGGVDAVSGSGLDKDALTQSLTTIFKDLSASATAQSKAQQVSAALNTYFAQAKVYVDISMLVGPTPGVGSPVGATGVYVGTGTGNIEHGSGAGLDVQGFVDSLKAIVTDLSPESTAEMKAQQLADAIDTFAKTAKVDTTNAGSFSGGSSTVTPPAFSGVVTDVPSSGVSLTGTIS